MKIIRHKWKKLLGIVSMLFAISYLAQAQPPTKWIVPMGSPVNPSPAIGPSGTVYEVYGTTDANGFPINVLYALNPSTGSVEWNYQMVYGEISPTVSVGADGTVYVTDGYGTLYSLNGANGSQNWNFPMNGFGDTIPAIGSDGTIYVTVDDGYNGVFAINPNGTQTWALNVDGSYEIGVFSATSG